eukprot:jgi/Tetstr1/441225/TSEL_029481.t1
MATLRMSCGFRLAFSQRVGAPSSRLMCSRLVGSSKATPPASSQLTPYTPSILRNNLAMASAGRRPLVCMAGGMEDMITEKNNANPVMVYSKTYCPFCMEVKSLFSKLGVDATVVELDSLADGNEVQGALSSVSGSSTVPQVFIGGEFLGGCDDTMSAHRSGKLMTMLEGAGVSVSN